MGLFDTKNPVLIDLDKGIIGTFVRLEEDPTEKGFVYPVFVPLNSLKRIKYGKSISKRDITDLYPDATHKGVETKWMVIYKGGKDSLVDFIDTKFKERIVELEDKIQDMEIELQATEQRARDAYEGASKTIAQSKELTKSSITTKTESGGSSDSETNYFENL